MELMITMTFNHSRNYEISLIQANEFVFVNLVVIFSLRSEMELVLEDEHGVRRGGGVPHGGGGRRGVAEHGGGRRGVAEHGGGRRGVAEHGGGVRHGVMEHGGGGGGRHGVVERGGGDGRHGGGGGSGGGEGTEQDRPHRERGRVW
ncbi:hypothetical protein OROGR_022093 [Orobanche gracilis]